MTSEYETQLIKNMTRYKTTRQITIRHLTTNDNEIHNKITNAK